MINESKHTKGQLFDMICNDICPHYVKRKDIIHILARTNGIDGEWVIIHTTTGKMILIEENQLRKIRLKQLINKLKNNG